MTSTSFDSKPMKVKVLKVLWKKNPEEQPEFKHRAEDRDSAGPISGCDETDEAWQMLDKVSIKKIAHHGSEWFTGGTNDKGSLELEASLADVGLQRATSIINDAIELPSSLPVQD